jgi:hypothetical protein
MKILWLLGGGRDCVCCRTVKRGGGGGGERSTKETFGLAKDPDDSATLINQSSRDRV